MGFNNFSEVLAIPSGLSKYTYMTLHRSPYE